MRFLRLLLLNKSNVVALRANVAIVFGGILFLSGQLCHLFMQIWFGQGNDTHTI